METVAIIGGMYGDEGKGLMVDYMCDQMLKNHTRGAVVRFQGGAQSGHTVVTPEGKRHVFSHFGSGTLLGVPTILSSKFVCNPILFNSEYWELYKNVKDPDVMIDEDSYISTVYDAEFNRELERSRGDKRHGSVGVGFGETIEREEVAGLSLRYKDLYKSDRFILNKLDDIRQYYIFRIRDLGLKTNNIIQNECTLRMMLGDFIFFRRRTKAYSHKKLDFMIFEGGQGLGLDMEYGSFPHVTRSRTGIHHVQEFCNDHNIKLNGVIYVTRSYTTRHGAGPLKNEEDGYYSHVADETNKPSEFQGKLRFAPFDFDLFVELTGRDSDHETFNGYLKYTMTCTDQIPMASKIFIGGHMTDMEHYQYLNHIYNTFDLVSSGPTRNDVKEYH